MMRNVKEKNINLRKKKMDGDCKEPIKKRRFLISVNVLGSSGPLRFAVDEDEKVSNVIDKALKSYAREGRCPVLGFDALKFVLYSTNAESDALSPDEKIGSREGRNFLLCKNQSQTRMKEERSETKVGKGSKWRAWIHKSFSFKVSLYQ